MTEIRDHFKGVTAARANMIIDEVYRPEEAAKLNAPFQPAFQPSLFYLPPGLEWVDVLIKGKLEIVPLPVTVELVPEDEDNG